MGEQSTVRWGLRFSGGRDGEGRTGQDGTRFRAGTVERVVLIEVAGDGRRQW